jgi:hypothetical protein
VRACDLLGAAKNKFNFLSRPKRKQRREKESKSSRRKRKRSVYGHNYHHDHPTGNCYHYYNMKLTDEYASQLLALSHLTSQCRIFGVTCFFLCCLFRCQVETDGLHCNVSNIAAEAANENKQGLQRMIMAPIKYFTHKNSKLTRSHVTADGHGWITYTRQHHSGTPQQSLWHICSCSQRFGFNSDGVAR